MPDLCRTTVRGSDVLVDAKACQVVGRREGSRWFGTTDAGHLEPMGPLELREVFAAPWVDPENLGTGGGAGSAGKAER